MARRDACHANGLNLTGRSIGLTQSLAINLNQLLHLCHKGNHDQMPGLLAVSADVSMAPKTVSQPLAIADLTREPREPMPKKRKRHQTQKGASTGSSGAGAEGQRSRSPRAPGLNSSHRSDPVTAIAKRAASRGGEQSFRAGLRFARKVLERVVAPATPCFAEQETARCQSCGRQERATLR